MGQEDLRLPWLEEAWWVMVGTAAGFLRRMSAYTIQLVRWPLSPLFTFAVWRVMYAASGRTHVGAATLSGFLVTGIFGSILLSSSIWTSGYALEWERDEGTSGSLFLSPASRSAVIAGYGLGSFVWFLPSFLIVAILGWVTGAKLDVSDVLAAVLTVVSLLVASLSMGFALASLFILSRRGNLIANVMQPPLLLLAGFAVPISVLPPWVRVISNAIPITHSLLAFRPAVLAGANLGAVAPELLLTFGISIVYIVVGVIALHRMEDVARRLGQLDLY